MLVLLTWMVFSAPLMPAVAGPEPAVDAAADGPALQAALLSTAQALDEQVAESRGVLTGLSSVSHDYARYRKTETLDAKLRQVKDAVHEVNVLLPASVHMAEHFEAMSEADKKALFGRSQGDVESYTWALRERIERWSKARTEWATKVNDHAREDLDQAQSMMADPAMTASALGHMEMWVIGYHGRMLDAVDLLLPAAADSSGEPIALTAPEAAELARSQQIRSEIEAVVNKVAAVKAANAEAQRQKVAGARFPKGSPPSEAGVGAALEAEFGPALRMAEYAPWMVREEAYWVRGRFIVGTYRYLSVWLAAKTPSGKTYVYLTQVVSKKSGDGWGPIRYRGVSDSFEILPENLTK